MTITRAFCVAAIATAGLLLSGCTLLGQVSGPASTDADNTAAGTDDDPFKLAPGDCFDYDSAGDTVSTVDIVDCAVPHAYEAYASIVMTEDEYPGDDATQAEADQECGQPFIDYVGLSWQDSQYNYRYFSPTQESWDNPQLMDREILCLAFADDKTDITGSVKGSNR